MLETLETLETPVHSAEKKVVIKAISDFAGKITVADIATKTALPVLKASSLLNQIAYETGGHIAVGTAGNIVYEFDQSFQKVYLTRGSKNFFRRAWRITYNAAAYLIRLFSLVMFFLIRVSFGIILILSVVLVVVLVVVVVVALLAKLMDNDNNDSGPNIDFSGILGGMGGLFRYWAFDWLWDWWYWGSYIQWNQQPTYRTIPSNEAPLSFQPNQAGGKRKDTESFLDKCFSFLFGDGDPNQGLEERYWQTLGQVLRANNGVVIAEQLAPYAKVEGNNEDWVLPILVRFNGTCEVSESGHIIYSFPSFQQKIIDTSPATDKTNSSEKSIDTQPIELHALFRKHIESQNAARKSHAFESHLQTYLKEQLWELTHVSDGTITTIICFAAFVLVGSLWLITMLAVLPFGQLLFPLLVAMAAYGAMFMAVPAIRSLIIKGKNAEIEKRNSIRSSAANKLQNTDKDLQKKLDEAAQARKIAVQESNKEELAYTTDKDLLEQEFEQKSLNGKNHLTQVPAPETLKEEEAPVEIEQSESIHIKTEPKDLKIEND